MLIEFTVGNFLSFKDATTFSMQAASISEFQESNVFSAFSMNLLKSAVLYGANASGKSNLFKAMSFMKNMILGSTGRIPAEQDIPVTRFKLSTECESKPSHFEAVFLQDGTKYRYGFEVNPKGVQSEWLLFSESPSSEETLLFSRENAEFDIKSFPEAKDLTARTRPNALLISVATQFNGPQSTKVTRWFSRFSVIAGLGGFPIAGESLEYSGVTKARLKDTDFKKEILRFMRIADIDINDLELQTLSDDSFPLIKNAPEGLKRFYRESILTRVLTKHMKYDSDGKPHSPVLLELESEESEGTRKLFTIAGPIIETLQNGSVLVVDELDGRLHPLITKFLVTLFNECANAFNAQLVFATHDTNLLINTPFRRDQVWFAEKDKYGASTIYSLVEFKLENSGKKVRKDASFGKDYIQGKYGAVPFIGDINSLFSSTDAP